MVLENIGHSTRLATIRARPGNPRQGLLSIGGRVHPCALGRGGIAAFKREGDGATPLASMRVLVGFWRADRHRRPRSSLAFRPIRIDDGWCDAPDDANYNRPVRIPYPASHEFMLRNDRLYDHVIVLDWNIGHRKRGAGSAIFLHVAKPGLKPTEGCVAVAPEVMRQILPLLSERTVLRVVK